MKKNSNSKLFLLIFMILCIASSSLQLEISLDSFKPQKENELNYPSTAGGPGLEWMRTWGGTTPFDVWDGIYYYKDFGHDVAIDSQNNIYIAGETAYGSGKNDFCLVKYDSEGNELWSRIWGGDRYDSVYGVAVDSEDNVYISGDYHFYIAQESVDGQIATIKYSSNGTKLWENIWGGSGEEECKGLVVDSEDNIYIGGEQDENFLLLKYNKLGTLIWSRIISGSNPDWCYDIAIDPNENIILTGVTNSFGTFGHFNTFIVKYNKNGVKLWQTTYSGAFESWGYEVTTDSYNDIYILGNTDETGSDQLSLLKYSSSGSLLWKKNWSGRGYLQKSRFNSHNGDLAVNSEDLIFFTTTSRTLWVYNRTGDFQSAFDYSPSGIIDCNAISFDSEENIFLGGAKLIGYDYLCLVKYNPSRPPNISISFPKNMEIFSYDAPFFNISYSDPDIDYSWYTLNNSSNKYYIQNNHERINQTAWNLLDEGIISISFYANDSLGQTGVRKVFVVKDTTPPTIDILSPIANQLCGKNTINYNIIINDPHLNMTWYTLNGEGFNLFEGNSGTINQSAWDECGNGTVLIRFYANDSVNNLHYEEISVRKSIQFPQITIETPISNQLCGKNTIDFELTIDSPNLNKTWYTLNGEGFNLFEGNSGTINQSAWDECGNGTVVISFYANNTEGNIGCEEITVRKDILPPDIIFEFSTEFLNTTHPEYFHNYLKISCEVFDSIDIIWVYLCENSSGSFLNHQMINTEFNIWSFDLNISNLDWNEIFSFYFNSSDLNGNIGINDNLTIPYIIKIYDLQPPVTQIHLENNIDVNVVDKNTIFYLYAEDECSGINIILYRINNLEWIAYEEPFKLHNLKSGEYIIYFYSIDNDGNVEEIKEFTFIYKGEKSSSLLVSGYEITIIISMMIVIQIIYASKHYFKSRRKTLS